MSDAELQEEEREVLLSIYDGDPAFKQLTPTTFQYKVRECSLRGSPFRNSDAIAPFSAKWLDINCNDINVEDIYIVIKTAVHLDIKSLSIL